MQIGRVRPARRILVRPDVDPTTHHSRPSREVRLAGLRTTYFYDIDDPQLFGTNYNRIEKYDVRLLSDNSLLETTWYGYLRTTYNSVIRETG